MAESNARTVALGLVGSPICGGNVDLLVDRVLAGAASQGRHVEKVLLNDLSIRPCQSCGAAPHKTGSPKRPCCIHDDMDSIYALIARSEVIVLGTPVYFDSVSAQTKLLIDRCNCMTPLVARPDGSCSFEPLSASGTRAVLVAVAGSRQQFRTVRVTVKGFLAWIGAELVEEVLYGHDSAAVGAVGEDKAMMDAAFQAGVRAVGHT